MTRRVVLVVLAFAMATACFTAEASSIRSLFKKVNPSVVIVLTEENILSLDEGEVSAPGLGSGVLISKDGKVMTAAHVVQTAHEVDIGFLNGEIIPATIIGSEPAADVALLQLERMPKGAVVAELADSDRVGIGDEIFIIGAPYGLSHSLTVGHISSRHQPNTVGGDMTLAEFFQTDAAVNQGNSGGPMFNMRGEVIGIVSFILTQSGGFEGIGFAATANIAKEYLLQRKPFWGGIKGFMLEGMLAEIFNLPQNRGILVQRIAKGSPAEGMGLQGGILTVQIGEETDLLGGDIILGVDNVSLAGKNGYLNVKDYISKKPAESTVKIRILRAGIQRDLEAVLKR